MLTQYGFLGASQLIPSPEYDIWSLQGIFTNVLRPLGLERRIRFLRGGLNVRECSFEPSTALLSLMSKEAAT
jgi:hypothetical protein